MSFIGYIGVTLRLYCGKIGVIWGLVLRTCAESGADRKCQQQQLLIKKKLSEQVANGNLSFGQNLWPHSFTCYEQS